MQRLSNSTDTDNSPATWRIKLGTWMFYVPFALFFGAPVLIPLLGFSPGQTAALIGGTVVSAEVIWFVSVPLLGKARILCDET